MYKKIILVFIRKIDTFIIFNPLFILETQLYKKKCLFCFKLPSLFVCQVILCVKKCYLKTLKTQTD